MKKKGGGGAPTFTVLLTAGLNDARLAVARLRRGVDRGVAGVVGGRVAIGTIQAHTLHLHGKQRHALVAAVDRAAGAAWNRRIVVTVGAIVAVVVGGKSLGTSDRGHGRGLLGLREDRWLPLEMAGALAHVGTKRRSVGMESGTDGLVADISNIATVGGELAAVAVGQGASRNATHAGIVVVQMLLSSLVRSGANGRARNGLEGRDVTGRKGTLQLGGVGERSAVVGGRGRVRSGLGELLLDRLHLKRVTEVRGTSSDVGSFGGNGGLRGNGQHVVWRPRWMEDRGRRVKDANAWMRRAWWGDALATDER